MSSVSPRRTGLAAIILALGLAPQPAARAAPPGLLLLTEESPPYNMTIDDDVAGIATDMVREVMARTGQRYDLRIYPWKRAFTMAAKTPDTCVFATTLTEARRPMFKWVGPLVHNTQVLFGRKGHAYDIREVDDLRRYVVGGYAGDAVTVYLEGQGVAVRKALADRTNARMLEAGHIDLWATGEHIGQYWARQEQVHSLEVVYRVQDTEMYLACNPAMDDARIAAWNDAVAAIVQDGTAARIRDAYR